MHFYRRTVRVLDRSVNIHTNNHTYFACPFGLSILTIPQTGKVYDDYVEQIQKSAYQFILLLYYPIFPCIFQNYFITVHVFGGTVFPLCFTIHKL
jgi:hypothetical protein